MKVLIIDDDEQTRRSLANLLRILWKCEEVGLEIEEAGTLAAGLALAESANLTILDLGLPDSDLVTTIQSISRFPPPVIVLTGTDDPTVSASCVANGAAHVFVKGSLIGFMPLVFEQLQKDVVRRAKERVS